MVIPIFLKKCSEQQCEIMLYHIFGFLDKKMEVGLIHCGSTALANNTALFVLYFSVSSSLCVRPFCESTKRNRAGLQHHNRTSATGKQTHLQFQPHLIAGDFHSRTFSVVTD